MTTKKITDKKIAGVGVEGFTSYLGEGFHTALRRAASSRQASKAYDAISQMSDDEWAVVLLFVSVPLLEYIAQEQGKVT